MPDDQSVGTPPSPDNEVSQKTIASAHTNPPRIPSSNDDPDKWSIGFIFGKLTFSAIFGIGTVLLSLVCGAYKFGLSQQQLTLDSALLSITNAGVNEAAKITKVRESIFCRLYENHEAGGARFDKPHNVVFSYFDSSDSQAVFNAEKTKLIAQEAGTYCIWANVTNGGNNIQTNILVFDVAATDGNIIATSKVPQATSIITFRNLKKGQSIGLSYVGTLSPADKNDLLELGMVLIK